MILIKKNKPSTLLMLILMKITLHPEWKKFPRNYESFREVFDDADRLFFVPRFKERVREELYAEQHGLCAYCMSKLSLGTIKTSVKIEHFKPIDPKENSNCKDGVFDYNNYFLVCMGGSDRKGKIKCCDVSRGSKKLTIDPKNKDHILNIYYDENGYILYSDKNNIKQQDEIQNDINYTLRLNGKWNKDTKRSERDTATELVSKRQQAYKEAMSKIHELQRRNKCTEKNIKIIMDKVRSNHNEFEGVYTYVYSLFIKTAAHNSSKKTVSNIHSGKV